MKPAIQKKLTDQQKMLADVNAVFVDDISKGTADERSFVFHNNERSVKHPKSFWMMCDSKDSMLRALHGRYAK